MENELDEALSALLGDSASSRDLLETPAAAQPSDPELRRLLAAAQEVRDALSVTPSPAAQQRHLQRLAEEAAKPAGRAARASKRAGRRLPRFLLRPAAALAAASLLAVPTLAFAAQSAQPGTVLYGTKLVVEQVQLAIEQDPADDARLHLRFAQKRIDELARLAAEGKDGPEVTAVLANLSSHQQDAAKQIKTLEAKGEAPPSLEGRVMKVLVRNVVVLETLSFKWECVVSDAVAPNPPCPPLAQAQERTQQSIQTLEKEPSGIQAAPTPSPTPSPSPTPTPTPTSSPTPTPTPTSSPTPTPTPTSSPTPTPTPTSSPTASPPPSPPPGPPATGGSEASGASGASSPEPDTTSRRRDRQRKRPRSPRPSPEDPLYSSETDPA